jgi:hypothetical protein
LKEGTEGRKEFKEGGQGRRSRMKAKEGSLRRK